MSQYYIYHEQKQVGPWTEKEILSQLSSLSLNWMDYVYDETKGDWITLMEHSVFALHFSGLIQPQNTSHSNQASSVSSVSAESPREHTILDDEATQEIMVHMPPQTEWYLLRGENKYGPFTYLEIIRFLQAKEINEYDFIWNKEMIAWSRVAECDDFKSEKIKSLKESGVPEVDEIFFRRRHARARFGGSLLIHNNKKLWKAEALEISVGGAGFISTSKEFEMGQTLFLHLKAGDGVPSFNAVCAVVSKQYVESHQTHVRYGVEFKEIRPPIQSDLENFTKKHSISKNIEAKKVA